MAVYKVPQDVEADDKLIGPFNFRQFVYLLISAGLIAMAVGLAQLFPLLAIIPLPPVALFLALALPLKKDQPMETYLAALVSFHLKPRKKIWMPGQKETTIVITAPKIVEDVRTNGLSEDEATRRLSFLADVVDTQGQSIKNPSILRDDLAEEANNTIDMFDERSSFELQQTVAEDETARHRDALLDMQKAIAEAERLRAMPGSTPAAVTPTPTFMVSAPTAASSMPSMATSAPTTTFSVPTTTFSAPTMDVAPAPNAMSSASVVGAMPANGSQETVNNLANQSESSIIELANNSDFSVATIAKEANRIKRKEKDEVFVSLH